MLPTLAARCKGVYPTRFPAFTSQPEQVVQIKKHVHLRVLNKTAALL